MRIAANLAARKAGGRKPAAKKAAPAKPVAKLAKPAAKKPAAKAKAKA
jgi:hypothetical protein